MTTPTGLLRYGQAGRYSGWDDRVVITALSGRRTGVVVQVRLAAAAGLTITLEPYWLAVAPCGDGTTAVITSPIAVAVPVAPGGDADRRDQLVAEIADPDVALWSISVLPEGQTSGGLVLGWLEVPAGASSAAEMILIPREQDFSTGGAIPGPVGPPGPQGPPGSATLIVGTFHNRTPDELPADGFIEAGWDGPGNPANDVQVEIGWSVIYAADGSMWTYVSETGIGGPWLSPGVVQGPPGERGPEGPQGPTGPPGSSPPFWPAETTDRTFTAGAAFFDITQRWVVPAGLARPGAHFRLNVWGTGLWPNPQDALNFRGNITGSPGLGQINIGATVLPAGAGFHFRLVQDLWIAGANIEFRASAGLELSAATGNLNGATGAQATMGATRRGSGALNSAAAWQMWMEASWNLTGGSRQLQVNGSQLELVAGWPGQAPALQTERIEP